MVLVCCLVVLAGCAAAGPSAGSTDGAGTGTDSGGPAGTTPTASTQSTTGPSATDFPPGVSKEGLENVSLVAKRSQWALMKEGYVGAFRLETTVRRQGRTRNMTLAQREIVEPGASTVLFQVKRLTDQKRSRRDAWVNGSTSVLRLDRAGTVTFRRINGTRIRRQLGAKQLLIQYGGAGDFEFEGAERTDNGTFLTYRATEYVEAPTAQMPAPANVTSYRAVVVLDTAGRLRYLDVQMTYEGPGGGTASIRVRFVVRQLGNVSVTRPGWVDRALANSSSG